MVKSSLYSFFLISFNFNVCVLHDDFSFEDIVPDHKLEEVDDFLGFLLSKEKKRRKRLFR